MNKSVLIGIVVIVLIVLGSWIFKSDNESLVIEDNAVALSDQRPGSDILVQYAKLKEPGFIVIYKVNEFGERNSDTILY